MPAGNLDYQCRRCGHKESLASAPDLNEALLATVEGRPALIQGVDVYYRFLVTHQCNGNEIGLMELTGGHFVPPIAPVVAPSAPPDPIPEK